MQSTMQNTMRHLTKPAIFAVAALAVAVGLAGCPLPPTSTVAVVTIMNDSETAELTSFRISGPNQSGYGPNMLGSGVEPGEMRDVTVDMSDYVVGQTIEFDYVINTDCETDDGDDGADNGSGSMNLRRGGTWTIFFDDECVTVL